MWRQRVLVLPILLWLVYGELGKFRARQLPDGVSEVGAGAPTERFHAANIGDEVQGLLRLKRPFAMADVDCEVKLTHDGVDDIPKAG
jgi:hypothetical protein